MGKEVRCFNICSLVFSPTLPTQETRSPRFEIFFNYSVLFVVYIPPDPISLCKRTQINNFGLVPGKVFRDRAIALYKMGVLLLVIDMALVAVMTWLGLTGKFGQGGIPTPLTTLHSYHARTKIGRA